MPNTLTLKMLKRSELFRELSDKKQPLYGSFNSKYIQEFKLIIPLINRIFQENYDIENHEKMFNRYCNSAIVRNYRSIKK